MRKLEWFVGGKATPIEQEWAYLKREEFWKLCALFVVAGIAPITMGQWLEPYQAAAFGLCFLTTAVGS